MAPTNCVRTALLVLVFTAVLAPAAYAQSGPLEPRLVIAGQGYPEFEPELAIEFLAATAELNVDADGRVTAVTNPPATSASTRSFRTITRSSA